MKVCHIVPSLQEQHGGPSKSVRSLCQALARTGIETDLYTTAPDAPVNGTETQDGVVRIRTFRRDWPARLCISRGLRAALADANADLVHHHALWLRTLHYADREATRKRVPLVVSPRGMMSKWAWRHHYFRKQCSRWLVHPSALQHVSGWHATSAEEQSDIAALGFSAPICVAPNGVEAPTEATMAAAVAHWTRVCPDVVNRPTALFYSRFHEKKRVIELIDLWLEQAPADWLLLLVGVPETYTPQELEQYVQKASAGGRVRAYAGVGQPAPYAVAQLFLLPSHNENFGLVIAEALAHGLPALVTDTTPWTGLNIDGRGWCVPWNQYGLTLRRATAESPSQLRERGSRARAWVLDQYSWDRAAKGLGDFYRALLPLKA